MKSEFRRISFRGICTAFLVVNYVYFACFVTVIGLFLFVMFHPKITVFNGLGESKQVVHILWFLFGSCGTVGYVVPESFALLSCICYGIVSRSIWKTILFSVTTVLIGCVYLIYVGSTSCD